MKSKNTESTYYLSRQLKGIPDDKKNVYVSCGDVMVHCCVGKTKVSVDDFINNLCNLELRV